MPPLAFSQPILEFSDPPTTSEASLLLDARVLTSVDLTESDHFLEVAPVARSIWLWFPLLVVAGLVATLAPWIATWFGAAWVGWLWYALIVLLTWFVVLPILLVLLATAWMFVPSQQPLLVVNKRNGEVHLPPSDTRLAEGQVIEIVNLARWAPAGGRWQRFVQISILARNEDDTFVLYPVFTQTERPLAPHPVAIRLARLFDRPLTAIEMNLDQSREPLPPRYEAEDTPGD